MPMKPKEIIRLLKIYVFIKLSQNGCHLKMKNFKTGKLTTVRLHSKDLKKRLEDAILKQAGLK